MDSSFGLDGFVRLSLVPEHPMMFVAGKEGRIAEAAIFEISVDIVDREGTLFSDQNTNRHDCSIQDTPYHLHFDTMREPDHFELPWWEKPFFQGEVLVSGGVPLEYFDGYRIRPLY